MRILFFGNNQLAVQVLRHLRRTGDAPVGLVLHPPAKAKSRRELLSVARLGADRIFDGSRLRDPKTLERIKALRPDLGISVMFGYILTPSTLSLLPKGCLNLHLSYLPYNRGAYPNVWCIVEGTPAGVSLHYMDPGVDTGPILKRRKVPVEPADTGYTLYRKLESAGLQLFKDAWPRAKSGRLRPIPQDPRQGSIHRVADVLQIDELNPKAQMPVGRLIDLLRARTFPPYPGAYMRVGSRKILIRVHLEYDREGKGQR